MAKWWPMSRVERALREQIAFLQSQYEARIREKDDIIRSLRIQYSALEMRMDDKLRTLPKRAQEIAQPFPPPEPDFAASDYATELNQLPQFYEQQEKANGDGK